MRDEIINSLVYKEYKEKVLEELKIMQETPAYNGGNLLESFYYVWQKNKNIKGEINEINSWTAYALGMTDKKPEEDKEFLPKRRIFCRAGFPDIDTDFDYERRSEIYSYLINKYGQERVGNIGTYQAMKMKSYLRRAIKSLDPIKSFFVHNSSSAISEYVKGQGRINKEWESDNKKKADEIINSLPPQRGAVLKVTDSNGEEHVIKTVRDAYKWCPEFAYYMDKYPDILKHSQHIEGLLSIYSVHPAGVCLCDIPLADLAPLRQTKITKENEDGIEEIVYATQYTYEDLEKLGLIKFDILAISTLTVISECVKMIKERYGINIDVRNLDLEDKKTFDLYKSGNLVGVFQAEEAGMQKTFVQVGCDRFEDIVAIIALYRPGPLASIPTYANRKNGLEPISYFHPSIEPFVKPYLESTYGVICYQETLMQICNSLAGFSISDGYGVIKAVGKKNESLLKKYRNSFIDGCVSNKVNKDLAAEYWDKFVTPFAAYGFNKSHSCAYANLSYTTAYLKANFPEVFMCCYLNVESKRSKHEKVEHLESETERMGIEILPRSINKCKMKYEICAERDPSNGIMKSSIRPSIMCKGLSSAAALSIVSNQKYKDLRDFALKTEPKVVDKKAIEALCDAGFFDREKNKKNIVNDFCTIREDLKKALQKGVEDVDIFA